MSSSSTARRSSCWPQRAACCLALAAGLACGDVGPDDPHDRIDYIYLAPSAPASPTASSCALIFDQQVGGVFASDHIGVACEIALPGAPP